MIRISDAELEVMKIIWEREKATSVQIIEDLKDVTWNYNTIRTLIKRLLVKGAIEIVKKEGKTYTYRAVVDKEDYKEDITTKLLRKLYHGSFSELVVEYCDRGNVSIKEMKELMAKIDEIVKRQEKSK